MARKIPAKLVLELRAQGLSRNMIAKSRKIGKSSVSDVFQRADALHLAYEDIVNLSEMEVYQKLFPERHQFESLYKEPDYSYIHSELNRIGVTLKLLWKEYTEVCHQNSDIAMGYTKFCEGYQGHILEYKLTNHLQHKPGITTEVDWSGSRMEIIDRESGEVIPIYLFVGTLPYSQYTYVEPTLNMKSHTWLQCHVNMFHFFSGTTVRLVCDNLKTGVISHPKEGDIILNRHYEALGDHYLTAIMPAPVLKPKAKASVESAVGKIAMAVIAPLRNKQFFSLLEIKAAIDKQLSDYNKKTFQKREGSRQSVFKDEQAYLRPLPPIPFEIADWIYGRKVNLDCHIVYKKNYYSCPYQYVKQSVDLKVTQHLIEIHAKGERIATHKRYPDYTQYTWSTLPEHLPDQFHQPEWDDQRMLTWAKSIGPSTLEVLQRIFSSVKMKERGYRSCLSILNLTKKYSNQALESACQIALTKLYSPRYQQIKAILSHPIPEPEASNQPKSSEQLGYIRGANYYGGKEHDKYRD